MHCKHCGFENGEDDHRCGRCGRRIAGVVIAAPPGYIAGANALAPSLIVSDDTAEFVPTAGAVTANAQPPLFANAAPASNIIPFEPRKALTRPGGSQVPAATPARPQPAPAKASTRRTASTPDLQGNLDFIPSLPVKSRRLKTEVEAQVFCDQPVATTTHRLVAAAIDAGIILFGFGLLISVFDLMGGSLGTGKFFWGTLVFSFVLSSLLYGLIWAIAGRETAGMRYTELQLITFDGFPLDARSRALRFATSWLSFCAGGLGILWALVDEESLTWHDHISKTFPAIREVPGSFVKQRE